MKFNIIKQQKNPSLHREEYLIEIESNSNPSFEDVIKFIGKDKDLVVVKKIEGNFGRYVFNVDVVVYDSKEFKEKIEVIPRKIKKKMAEDAAKAEEEKKKAEEAAKVAAKAESEKEKAKVGEIKIEENVDGN